MKIEVTNTNGLTDEEILQHLVFELIEKTEQIIPPYQKRQAKKGVLFFGEKINFKITK